MSVDTTSSIAAFLLTYALHSTALLVGALILSRFIRTAAARELMYKVAIVGALVTTASHAISVSRVGFTAARDVTIAAPVRVMAPMSTVDQQQPRVEESVSNAAVVNTNTPRAGATHSRLRDRTPWTSMLVVAWLCGAVLLLARHAYQLTLMRRRLASRRECMDASLRELLLDLQQTMRIGANIALTTSDRIASPLAIGRTEICVPNDLCARLTPSQQRSMLAHELAHLLRGDTFWLRGLALIEAVFFIQPLNRIVRRRIQSCSEQLCDEWAVTLTHQPLALAQCLAEVARSVQARPLAYSHPAMMERTSSLVDRVHRVLQNRREPLRTSRVVQCAATAAVVMFAVVMPGVGMQAEASATTVTGVQDPARDPGIASAVRSLGNGTLRFSYATRDGVCGTGVEKDGTRMFALQPVGDWLPTGKQGMTALYVWDRGRLLRNDVGADGHWTTPCNRGPARVDMRVANGVITRMDISVADPAPPLPSPGRDIGMVDVKAAAAYLERLTNAGDSEVSDRAHVAWMMTPSYHRGAALQTPMTPPTVVAVSPRPPHPPRAPHAPTSPKFIVATPKGPPPPPPSVRVQTPPTPPVAPAPPRPPSVVQKSSPPVVVIPPVPPAPPAEVTLPRDLARLTNMQLAMSERLSVLDTMNGSARNVTRVLSIYPHVPDRAMRVELIKWLSANENDASRAYLMRTVKGARVLEEQQAALAALEASKDANARQFAKNYKADH